MKGLLLAVLTAGLLPGGALPQERPCQPRRHAKLPAITDSTYHKARKRLLAAGWQPVRTRSFNEASTDPDITYGNGPLFWRKGYVEVEACSVTHKFESSHSCVSSTARQFLAFGGDAEAIPVSILEKK